MLTTDSDSISRLISADRVVGLNQSRKLVRSRRCEALYLANDADIWLTELVGELCNECGITPCTEYTAEQLAQACGIDVPTAVVALKRGDD